MSAEEMAGVPREVQLTIRDEQGRVWLPRLISLQEIHYGTEHVDRAPNQAPAGALVDGSIWCVLVGFMSEQDAPRL
jgi:hypothetical protein